MNPLFPEAATARPLWLTTLADLGLLLVGFFVFLQATRDVDGARIARGIRAGFGVEAPAAPPPLSVDAAAIGGFAPGSAALPADIGALVAWTRGRANDPRLLVRVVGTTDGSAGDVDPATGSAALLAADRARAVAAMLARSGAVAPDRLVLATEPAPAPDRAVRVRLGFAGDRQALAVPIP